MVSLKLQDPPSPMWIVGQDAAKDRGSKKQADVCEVPDPPFTRSASLWKQTKQHPLREHLLKTRQDGLFCSAAGQRCESFLSG